MPAMRNNHMVVLSHYGASTEAGFDTGSLAWEGRGREREMVLFEGEAVQLNACRCYNSQMD